MGGAAVVMISTGSSTLPGIETWASDGTDLEVLGMPRHRMYNNVLEDDETSARRVEFRVAFLRGGADGR